MKCLTENEISQWLGQRGSSLDSGALYRSAHYLQFYAPKQHRAIDDFMRRYCELVVRSTETLIHITDWGLYTQSEMIAVMGVRSLHAETRLLIDAPGHSFEPHETETAVSLMVLTASFEWSSYLYCPGSHATLHNWEGDIFDFWTDDPAQRDILRSLLKDFGLNEVSNAAAPSPGAPAQ